MLYDGVMLLVLILCAARGAALGIAWQLAAIASLVLCFLFATPLSLVLAPWISVAPPLNRWLAMLGIYVVFSFACFAAARTLRHLLESIRFEEYDRHLGAVLGLLKGATFCFVATFFAVCLSERNRESILRTGTGYASAAVMRQLDLVMPAEIHDVLAPYAHLLTDPHISDRNTASDRGGINERRPPLRSQPMVKPRDSRGFQQL